MTRNPRLAALSAAGVSVGLDDLPRDRLRTGDPAELIDTMSVVGVTTKPTIFQHALSKGHAYDEQIRELAGRGADVDAAIRTVTTDDIPEACEVLHRQWEACDGVDGRVSIEVDPRLAMDTDKTVAEAIELWKIVDRPNLLITIPPPAIRAQLIERAALVEILSAEPSRKLTLLSAPAGWGKTTLLAQWASGADDRRRRGWLSLDASDNDPARFWACAIAAAAARAGQDRDAGRQGHQQVQDGQTLHPRHHRRVLHLHP
jgi:transaldolase